MAARSYLTERMSPRTYLAARLALRVLPSRRHHYAQQARIARALHLERDRVVRGGPFAGMRYVDDSVGGSLASKILGTYEMELHDAIEQAIARDVTTIVDVGSAEGFYAVGFALRCPRALVHAYDSSPWARSLCRRMARLNGVADRVQVNGRASPAALRSVVKPGTLVFSDCEGCEKAMMDPHAVPELLGADLIIELHDFVDPTISSSIEQRFAPSHDVTLIDSCPRDPARFAGLMEPFAIEDRSDVLDEGRPGPMQWAVVTR
jgi:hypothetical protein